MTGAASTLRVMRDPNRNPNSLWGFVQKFDKKVNFKKHPVFYTTLRVNGSLSSAVQVKIRFYSGQNILETSRILNANTPVSVGVSLANWKYRKSVTKIQIMAAPVSGGWNSGASFEMTLPVRGK